MTPQQIEVQEKCIALAVRVTKLHRYLAKEKQEYNHSDQLERAGAAIGALYSEAAFAESSQDFVHKLQIAQKEANEAVYWIKVLHRSDFLTTEEYGSILADAEEIMRIITSIILTAKRNQQKNSSIHHP